MTSTKRIIAGLALLLGLAPGAASAQDRVEIVSASASVAGYCRSGGALRPCGGRTAGTDAVELALEHALDAPADARRTPPRRSSAIERWLSRRFGVARARWGRPVARGSGSVTAHVRHGRRSVHVTERLCSGPDCDCPTHVATDVVYDARGRLSRYRRLITTCECVDASFVEDVLRYDARGELSGLERRYYEHPDCGPGDPDTAPPFSSDRLEREDGSMPPVALSIGCTVERAPHRLVCRSPERGESGFVARYDP